jgi:hypothetical protein
MTIGEVGVEEIEIDSVAGLLNSRLTLFGQSKQLAGYPKALPTNPSKAPPPDRKRSGEHERAGVRAF